MSIPSDHIHVLSDHAGNKLEESRAEKEEKYQQEMQEYQSKKAARQAKLVRQKLLCAQAWQMRQFFVLLKELFKLLMLALLPSARRPTGRRSITAEEEARYLGGAEGEQRVLNRLSEIVPDGWHVLCGYSNRFGETDLMLVTSNGVIAIEVKNYAGGLIYDSDGTWYARKHFYAPGGILKYETKAIQDKKGRPPYKQVNAIADQLENNLGKFAPNVHPGRIIRAVILAWFDKKGEVRQEVRIEQPNVDLLCRVEDLTREKLLNLLKPRSRPLDVDKLVAAIKKDHEHSAAQQARKNQEKARNGYSNSH
jgi:hypothetical protein